MLRQAKPLLSSVRSSAGLFSESFGYRHGTDVVLAFFLPCSGPSGSGKSSTVLLLERFYDPTAGQIFLDGVDLKDINVKHLRSNIGYVGQASAATL
jgi:ABC-type transport system involved in Fe-S cluster assembly fused permease/ATPase subunit